MNVSATNREPGEFSRQIFTRSTFDNGIATGLRNVNAFSPARGRAQMGGIALLDTRSARIVGDTSLTVDFDAAKMSGNAQNFAVYTTQNPGYDIQYTRVRDVNGSMALNGTVTQGLITTTGSLTASGTLTDTGSSRAIDGSVAVPLTGGIFRNQDNGNRLFGVFVNDEVGQNETVTAADGSTSSQFMKMTLITSE